MSTDQPCFVLDSFALLSHFQGERGGNRVVDLLENAQQGKCRLLLSLINLGEVCSIVERRRGLRDVHLILAAIDSLPIEILPADREAVLAAAHLKANFPVAYADAFAASAAQAYDSILLTGDLEFKAVEPILQIEWLAS